MQINLSTQEITIAIQRYISEEGINITGKAVNIKLINRQNVGVVAEINIEESIPEDPHLHSVNEKSTIDPIVSTEDVEDTTNEENIILEIVTSNGIFN